MNTVENNRLMAEFLQFNQTETNYFYRPESERAFRLGDLKFNYNWDWLMPAVEKIETMEYSVIISCSNCEIFDCNEQKTVWFGEAPTKIEATYIAIVKFIEWYNLNKK